MTIEILDKRETMANQLLMRGYATTQEIMAVSFGEWPPKGLDIAADGFLNSNVKLYEWSTKDPDKGGHEMGRGLGSVDWTKDYDSPERRWIDLDSKLSSETAGLYSIMGHEALHIMQADHIYTYRNKLLEFENEAKKKTGFFSKLVAKLFKTPHKPDIEENEQVRLSIQSASEQIMINFMDHKKKDGGGPVSLYTAHNIHHYEFYLGVESQKLYDHTKYVRTGHEIQARIHQVMIDGYQRWGRLPTTSDEFYAAMQNSGAVLPKHIQERLESGSTSGDIQLFLKAEPGLNTTMIRDIQLASNSLMPDSKKLFWDKTMLALYSDMIEMYGDKLGRERFGLGKNPRFQNENTLSQNATTSNNAKPVSPKT